MKFKAYFKPVVFERENIDDANEFIESGDWMEYVECDSIIELEESNNLNSQEDKNGNTKHTTD